VLEMIYISTRGNHEPVTASTAIRLGMVPRGGLFVPEHIPVLKREQLEALRGKVIRQWRSSLSPSTWGITVMRR
jgi:threonine synthase